MRKMNDAFEQYYDEAVEPGRRERAYAWATTPNSAIYAVAVPIRYS